MLNNLSQKVKDRLIYLGLFLAVLIPITALIKSFMLTKAEGIILGRVTLEYLYNIENSYIFAAGAYIFTIVGFFILISFIDLKKLGIPLLLFGMSTVIFNLFLNFEAFNIKYLKWLFSGFISYDHIFFLVLIFSLIFLVYRLNKVSMNGARFAQVMTVLMLFNIFLATSAYLFTDLIGSNYNYIYFEPIASLWILSFVYLGIKKLDTRLAYFLGVVALIVCAYYIVLAEETDPSNLANLISQTEQGWFFGGGKTDAILDEISLLAIEERDIKICADYKFSEDSDENANLVEGCIYRSLEKLRWKDFEICSVIKDDDLKSACASAVMSRYSSSTVCEQIKDTYPKVYQECIARFGLNN